MFPKVVFLNFPPILFRCTLPHTHFVSVLQAPAFQLIERLTLRRCLPGAVAQCDEVWENQVPS